MRVGILGYGEVGRAIKEVYEDFDSYDVKIKDLGNEDTGFYDSEILNICIGYTENFIEIVCDEIKKLRPRLVIIHSTVPPKTTRKIKDQSPEGTAIVHSPVRGVHPNLYEGIKKMVKYVGSDDERDLILGESHLKELGLNVKSFSNSLTTEIGKILSTTYYGLVIAWHGEMSKLCNELGIDFDDAVTDFNKSYNEGYKKLGMGHVVRPVLYPPKEEKIGGHCIIPNAKFLEEIFDSEALKLIQKYSKS